MESLSALYCFIHMMRNLTRLVYSAGLRSGFKPPLLESVAIW